MDEARIREMWSQIEQEKIQKEREQVRYDQWLKEREEKKIELERQWRPNYGLNKSPNVIKTQKSVQDDMETDQMQQQAGTSSTPSPLLTSLLKSSQANQPPIQPSNTARSAPTITNLLTGSPSKSSSSSSSNSPLITQSSANAQNNLINASVSVALVPNVVINHSASSVQIPVSQSAPTLITLLDKKSQIASTALDQSTIEKQQLMMSISVPEGSGGKDGNDAAKDEEAELLADFNELIAEKDFDDEDLEDINSIIMNPEILEDKIPDDEPIKDVDDSSQATSTDDYDKLKIKQLVEDFAGVPVEPSPTPLEEAQEQIIIAPDPVEENEVIQVPSEPETSNPASIELVEPAESSDSKAESPQNDDKVMIISDESSNNSDEKKEQVGDKTEANEGEESQSVKSSVVDEVKEPSGEETIKEARAFQGIQEGNEHLASSEKESKEPATVYQVDDSDEDIMFEDAKDHHEDSSKADKEPEKETKLIEKASEPQTKSPIKSAGEVEEVSRSVGSVDSDDEVLEAKVSRSTGRKKASESKADSLSVTRSRDQSENDDKDPKPIRTRSRHSSVIPHGETKSTYNFPKEQDHSMWKARWEDCQKELQKLKDFSSIVDNKVIADDSYKRVVLRPMNMKLIQKNIENHVSTMPGDVKRDFALMCTNIMMSSKKGAKFDDMVQQFIKEGLEIIDSNMDVEDAYKSYRKQIKKKH